MVEPQAIWPSVNVAGELAKASIEWITANGAGAYASSTVSQMATRRYHGLLVAPVGSLFRRHVIVSHVDATVDIAGQSFSLATHQFPDVQPTRGYQHIETFFQDPLPRFVYQVAGGVLEQSLALEPGRNTLVLRYLWEGPTQRTLTLRPLLAMRLTHELMHRHGAMHQQVEMRRDYVSVRPVADLPKLTFLHQGAFVGSPDWWYRFVRLAERERGLDSLEDLWTPGVFRFSLESGKPVWFSCTLEAPDQFEPADAFERARTMLANFDPGPDRPALVRRLQTAASVYRVSHGGRSSLVAGYPWFHEWGRFSVLSFEGVFLVPGFVEDARDYLVRLVARLRDGLLPCELSDESVADAPRTVDGTLKLFALARRLRDSLPDGDEFIRSQILPALEGTLRRIRDGAIAGLSVSTEGFLSIRNLRALPTWMNARVDGEPVTPRAGLPIEVQAEWMRACESYLAMTEQTPPSELRSWITSVVASLREVFATRFWCEQLKYPYDFLAEDGSCVEGSRLIRPNALLALAVAPELFSREQAHAIVSTVDRELMTPVGIRTLSPTAVGYRGLNRGTIDQLDRSYHQGSVWLFLLGAYGSVCRRLYGDQGTWRERLVEIVERVVFHNEAAVGQVSELADGDFPHRAAGCFAFAPSVAELLRVLVEDVGL